MNKSRRSIICLILYVLFGVLVSVMALVFSVDSDEHLKDQFVDINDGWIINGERIDLPCTARGKVVMERQLPSVYRNQVVVVHSFFKNADVYIGGQLVMSSKPSSFMGRDTYVGNKELKIPLKPTDDGKTIRIELDVQNSVYSRRISDAFIYTKSGYISYIIIKNIVSLSLVSTFFITGVFEILIAIYYIFKGTRIKAHYTFMTLLFTGVFSIISSIWVTTETLVLPAIFGNATAYAIMNDVFFMLMPLTFLELLKTLTQRKDKREDVLIVLMTVLFIGSCLICLFGLADWNLTEYAGQFMVILVFIHVACISYSTMRSHEQKIVKTTIAVGNAIFVFFSALGLIIYMLGISQNYLAIVIAGLMSYAFVQIFLVLQRIGISIDEEEQFEKVTKYAYYDDLTGLGNRRYFYSKVDAYAKGELPENLGIISIDANRLKFYNDTAGHDAGDELLRGAADCIVEAFSWNKDAVIGRMGGDEFAVLIVTDKEKALESIDDLKKRLSSFKGTVVENISIAIGFAQAMDYPNETIYQLYKHADDLMYQDKREYYKRTGYERRRG